MVEVNVAVLKKAIFGLHIVQAIWTVVLMGVLISSLLQDGPASSSATYMFTMCWFMIPVLIYLTQAPRFQRTLMFAHPYWVMAMNSIFSLLWFAAFVSVASYTNRGISNGANRETDQAIKDRGGCALFPAGNGETEKACQMNRTAVGLGVIMWFLWLATTAIAGYAAFYFRAHSVSPFEDLTVTSHEIQETTKDAFSSNDEYALIAKSRDVEEEHDDDVHHHPRAGSIASYDSAHGPMHGPVSGHGRSGSAASYDRRSGHGRSGSIESYDTYGEPRNPDAHPGQPVPWGEGREAYGIGGHGPIPPAGTLAPAGAPHIGLDMPISPIDMDYTYRGSDLR